MQRNGMTLTLIDQDNEALEDVHGHTGGPEYNLGKEYSRRATWRTSDPEMPYYSVETVAYVNGYLVDHTGERVDEHGNMVEYQDARDANDKPLPSATGADFERGVWIETGEPLKPGDMFIEYFEQCCTGFAYHEEPYDPWGAEILSGTEYDQDSHISHIWPSSLEQAEQNCKDYLSNRYNAELWYNWSV